MKIGIVGSGIAAMSAAYFLKDTAEITFFEKNNYPGGHTNTLEVKEDGQSFFIDSAFMVFNEVTYPNFCQFLKDLKVESQPTCMSFGVQHVPTGLEYRGTSMNCLFAQRKNLFNVRYWKMLLQMNRFCKEAPEVLNDTRYASVTLEGYVKEKGYGDDFLNQFLIPMSSAIWSTPIDKLLNFPAVTLVQFFKNHGFLGLSGHFQWRTICGGSQTYRDRLLEVVGANIHLNESVQAVRRSKDCVNVVTSKNQYEFDRVIIATHVDSALAILKDHATHLERNLLQHFSYQTNTAKLHTDASVMPKQRRAWSSWNYRMHENKSGEMLTCTIYDMNSLQNLKTKKNYFISINDPDLVKDDDVIWSGEYDHPIFDCQAIQAQRDLPRLNDDGQIYFCGSYFRYGFHEDAFVSGKSVAEKILGREI